MSYDGKLLEIFVRQIEKILLPENITVTPNDKVYNDEGVQVAEFDIEIEGKVGAAHFKWLIECRDRPSQGPAPGTWIEQLVGRRDRFNFNKVIAVSTTGFAPGAEEYATQAGIEIRNVTEANVDNISDWFSVETMPLTKQGGKLEHAQLFISNDEPEKNKEAVVKLLNNIDGDAPILMSTETNNKVTLATAFQAVVKDENLYEQLSPEEDSKNIRIKVSYPRDDSHYIVQTEEGDIRITEILFDGVITLTTEELEIAAIKSYENLTSGEEIATAASFNFNIAGKNLELSFNKMHDTGETHVLLSSPKDNA
ncbi:MAG: hypothetical protein WBP02_07330 [Gammaproteobacteria bacterium]